MRKDNDRRPEEKPVIKDRDIERRKQADEDDVEEASMESFPASDAPSWSATTANAPKDKEDKAENKKDKNH